MPDAAFTRVRRLGPYFTIFASFCEYPGIQLVAMKHFWAFLALGYHVCEEYLGLWGAFLATWEFC
jgi:hypothetical protein